MREKEMRLLLNLKEHLQQLILQKQGHISQIEAEIAQLQFDIDQIMSEISSCSFTTADSLLDAEQAATKGTSPQTVMCSKKIYSPSKELLVSMQFDNNIVTIHFPTPKLCGITQEKYIDQIVKPILVKLKKNEPKLQPSIEKTMFDGMELIDSIILQNVLNFESFEYLYDSFESLFSNSMT